MIFTRRHWGLWAVVLVVGLAGLFVGQWRQEDRIRGYYRKVDFSLLDDKGEIFHLKDFPADRLLLLVFTPDGLPTNHVSPFARFNEKINELKERNIEVMVVTRTHREISRNFLLAAGYQGRLLHDLGGTVGGKVGVWDGFKPSPRWGYGLMDRTFSLHWTETAPLPLAASEILQALDLKREQMKAPGYSPP
jgi:peroxiredoxin